MRNAVTLALVLTACTSSTPEPKDLPQGLSVLDATDTSLTAAYRKGDVAIFVETHRGKPRPATYQTDPNRTQYEVDLRVSADDGRTFYVLRGGDRFVDPTWATQLAAQMQTPGSRVSNAALFDMAHQAGIELAAQRDELDALVPQVDTVIAFGKHAPELWARMLELRSASGMPDLDGEVAYGGTSGPEPGEHGYGANYYYIQLHAADIDGSPAGYHSAVRLQAWNGSAWGVAADFANHGRSPSEMPWVNTLQIENYGWKGSDWMTWTCNTGYATYSDDGGHNCHDDSRLEMASYVFGNGHQKDPGWSYWCNGADDDTDISVNIFGWELDHSGYPNTSADYEKGYLHPHTCRGQNNHGFNGAAGCYCDQACLQYNDCCIDGPY